MTMETTRRGFVELLGAASVAQVGANFDTSDDGDVKQFDAYGQLIGPESALPEKNGAYLQQFDTYQLTYDSTDSQNQYYTNHRMESWKPVGCIVQKNGSLYFRKQT